MCSERAPGHRPEAKPGARPENRPKRRALDSGQEPPDGHPRRISGEHPTPAAKPTSTEPAPSSGMRPATAGGFRGRAGLRPSTKPVRRTGCNTWAAAVSASGMVLQRSPFQRTGCNLLVELTLEMGDGAARTKPAPRTGCDPVHGQAQRRRVDQPGDKPVRENGM